MTSPAGIRNLEKIGRMVTEAEERIAPYIARTPLLRVPWLDGPASKVWIKLDCWQSTGSFKVRGAYNALLSLPPDQDVFTASAGNHGLAIASAAAQLHRRCHVIVPESASELKIRRLIATGCNLKSVGRDLFEAGIYAKEQSQRHGGAYVSAFNDWNVTAGQGTCVAECLHDLPHLSSVVLPLGGGGLAVGSAAALMTRNSSAQIWATHPARFGRVFGVGIVHEQLSKPVVPTIADGLAVQVERDGVIAAYVEGIAQNIWSIGEDDIKTAILAMLHLEGILLEGAGAISIAALLSENYRDRLSGEVVVLATGRNISSSDVGHAIGAPVRDVAITKAARSASRADGSSTDRLSRPDLSRSCHPRTGGAVPGELTLGTTPPGPLRRGTTTSGRVSSDTANTSLSVASKLTNSVTTPSRVKSPVAYKQLQAMLKRAALPGRCGRDTGS